MTDPIHADPYTRIAYWQQRAEQAERQKTFAEDQAVKAAEGHGRMSAKLVKAEARLAKVPALVNDALQLCDQHISDEQRKETQRRVIEWATAWESE